MGRKIYSGGPRQTVLFPAYPGPSVWKATPPSCSTLSPLPAEVVTHVEQS